MAQVAHRFCVVAFACLSTWSIYLSPALSCLICTQKLEFFFFFLGLHLFPIFCPFLCHFWSCILYTFFCLLPPPPPPPTPSLVSILLATTACLQFLPSLILILWSTFVFWMFVPIQESTRFWTYRCMNFWGLHGSSAIICLSRYFCQHLLAFFPSIIPVLLLVCFAFPHPSLSASSGNLTSVHSHDSKNRKRRYTSLSSKY